MKNRIQLYKFLLLLVFLIITINSEVVRFNNDIETKSGGTWACPAIINYTLNVPYGEEYTIETTNLTAGGDTYMYLWSEKEHRQMARNDDGGEGLASKITMHLPYGVYKVFVRSYSSNIEGYCDLEVNGVRKLNQNKFSGTIVYLIEHMWVYLTEARVRTKNGNDPYLLAIDDNNDLMAYNDDDPSGGYEACLYLAEVPKFFILGAWLEPFEGECEIWVTEDRNLEFLSLYGSLQEHKKGALSFAYTFDPQTNPAGKWTAVGITSRHIDHWENGVYNTNTMNGGIDDVDLVFVSAHGASGRVETLDEGFLDITCYKTNAGGNNILNANYGDLEYMAFQTCQTVRIEHTQSFDWLRDDGWASGISPHNGGFYKGFFDGVHLVLGYHSNYSCYPKSSRDDSNEYDARIFAEELEGGNTLWESWKNANERTYQSYHSWFTNGSPGMASMIAVYDKRNEKLSDFRSEDIAYGHPRYGTWSLHWYGRSSDVPQP